MSQHEIWQGSEWSMQTHTIRQRQSGGQITMIREIGSVFTNQTGILIAHLFSGPTRKGGAARDQQSPRPEISKQPHLPFKW